ncbi:hypothetical protein GGF42_004541 [Coemansia sp. RSA 2424]|nr:hypothetical protein GGF42_004541 [Coemansia sp. RSA 2424]
MPPTLSAASTTPAEQFHTRVVEATDAELIDFPGGIEDGRFTISPGGLPSVDSWIAASRHELRLNRSIAIPTETVYGLAANALDAGAVRAIFGAKGRPSDNPLIVHVSSVRMLRALYHLPPAQEDAETMPFLGTADLALEGAALQQRLQEAEDADRRNGGDGVWPEIPRAYHAAIRRFWPGALTIVVPRPACIPLAVVGGGHNTTVAVRLPSHPVARAIIAGCGLPLAAPSANASGRPSPTTAAHVIHDLGGRIPLVVDGGACAVGVESTVVDAYSATAHIGDCLSPCVLRPGGVTVEALRSLGGDGDGGDGDAWGARLRVYRKDFASAELEAAPTTPGMKYRHYSPTAPVHVFATNNNNNQQQQVAMQLAIERLARDEGRRKIGVVAVQSPALFVAPDDCALVVHCVEDARDLARRIFALLRVLDETDHVDAILVQGVDDKDEGLAVMNRLEKAATHIHH